MVRSCRTAFAHVSLLSLSSFRSVSMIFHAALSFVRLSVISSLCVSRLLVIMSVIMRWILTILLHTWAVVRERVCSSVFAFLTASHIGRHAVISWTTVHVSSRPLILSRPLSTC